MLFEQIKSTETQIRELVEDWAQAVRTKDIDGLMGHYALDFKLFDICTELQSTGAKSYRQKWKYLFSQYEGPILCEMKDAKIIANDTVAFYHGLTHMGGKLVNGKEVDMWLRVTVGYQKMNDQWKVVHEHVSVPADMETGFAMLDLTPSH